MPSITEIQRQQAKKKLEANRASYAVDVFGDQSFIVYANMAGMSDVVVLKMQSWGLTEWQEQLETLNTVLDQVIVEWSADDELSLEAIKGMPIEMKYHTLTAVFDHSRERQQRGNSNGKNSRKRSQGIRKREFLPGTDTDAPALQPVA